MSKIESYLMLNPIPYKVIKYSKLFYEGILHVLLTISYMYNVIECIILFA